MSDEQIRLPQEQPQQAKPAGIFEHRCEEPGCTKWGGFGFGSKHKGQHFFCSAHRESGERYL
jgi:hypothetical protein